MGNLVFQASSGGQTTLSGTNTASSFTITVPAITGTMVTTGDTATVTSTMISGPLTGTVGGTGVNNGSNTITIAGNLSHSGAFTQSFVATANTAVTLPAGNTASANNLLSSATAVGIVTGTPSSTTYLRGDGTWSTISTSSGTVTTVSVVSANGFTGTVANPTTTPAITLTTSITGLLQGNGTAISAVTVGSGLSFTGGTLSATSSGGTAIGLVRAIAINCIFP